MKQPDNNVLIRRMVIDDYDAVSGLFIGLDKWHSEHLPWLFQRFEKSLRNRAMIESLLQDELSAIFVAHLDSIIGFVHVILRQLPNLPVFVPQLRGLVDSIYVDPGSRRNGIASGLMHAAEDWALGKGAQGMDVNVYEFNTQARDLFTAMGYSNLSRKMSKQTEST